MPSSSCVNLFRSRYAKQKRANVFSHSDDLNHWRRGRRGSALDANEIALSRPSSPALVIPETNQNPGTDRQPPDPQEPEKCLEELRL